VGRGGVGRGGVGGELHERKGGGEWRRAGTPSGRAGVKARRRAVRYARFEKLSDQLFYFQGLRLSAIFTRLSPPIRFSPRLSEKSSSRASTHTQACHDGECPFNKCRCCCIYITPTGGVCGGGAHNGHQPLIYPPRTRRCTRQAGQLGSRSWARGSGGGSGGSGGNWWCVRVAVGLLCCLSTSLTKEFCSTVASNSRDLTCVVHDRAGPLPLYGYGGSSS
jgi:hypothetical protein